MNKIKNHVHGIEFRFVFEFSEDKSRIVQLTTLPHTLHAHAHISIKLRPRLTVKFYKFWVISDEYPAILIRRVLLYLPNIT